VLLELFINLILNLVFNVNIVLLLILNFRIALEWFRFGFFWLILKTSSFVFDDAFFNVLLEPFTDMWL